jgi:hypothetical protein
MVEGIGPVRLLLYRSMAIRLVMLPYSGGIGPWKLFPPSSLRDNVKQARIQAICSSKERENTHREVELSQVFQLVQLPQLDRSTPNFQVLCPTQIPRLYRCFGLDGPHTLLFFRASYTISLPPPPPPTLSVKKGKKTLGNVPR